MAESNISVVSADGTVCLFDDSIDLSTRNGVVVLMRQVGECVTWIILYNAMGVIQQGVIYVYVFEIHKTP